MKTKFNDIFKEYSRLSKVYQRTAILSCIVSSMAIVITSLLYWDNRNKPVEVYFALADRLGNVVSHGKETNVDFELIKKRDLENWLIACRTVTKDLNVAKRFLKDCSIRLSRNGDAYPIVNNYMNEQDREEIIKDYRIKVDISTFLTIKKNQYEIVWSETWITQKEGLSQKREFYRGTFDVFLTSQKGIIQLNPVGLIVKSISWAKMSIGN